MRTKQQNRIHTHQHHHPQPQQRHRAFHNRTDTNQLDKLQDELLALIKQCQ